MFNFINHGITVGQVGHIFQRNFQCTIILILVFYDTYVKQENVVKRLIYTREMCKNVKRLKGVLQCEIQIRVFSRFLILAIFAYVGSGAFTATMYDKIFSG
jgi:hypothetical protein